MPIPEEPGSHDLEEAESKDYSDRLAKAVLGDELYKTISKVGDVMDEDEYGELLEAYDKPIMKLIEEVRRASGEDVKKYTETLEHALLTVNFRLRLYKKFIRAAE